MYPAAFSICFAPIRIFILAQPGEWSVHRNDEYHFSLPRRVSGALTLWICEQPYPCNTAELKTKGPWGKGKSIGSLRFKSSIVSLNHSDG